jgi:radical SAM protein with 4Fe4S-binding SPASM domain
MTDRDVSYVPRLPRGLIHRGRESLHLFLHPDKPRWIVTNQLGQEIIGLCEGDNSIEAIASEIARRYGKHPNEVEKDVFGFLNELDRAKLFLRDAEEPSESPVAIRSIFLHLTDRCNLRCIHCYVGDSVRNTELNSQRIHDLIDELADAKGRAITFSGGEPLLRRDWFDLLEHAAERLDITLNTNGTLITAGSARLLSRIKPRVQVSLDGPDSATHDRIRGSGSFAAALRGIREIQQAGLGKRLIISMTLMKHNIARAPDMIKFAQEVGAARIRFLPLHSQGRAKSSWSQLDASLDQYLEWFRHAYYDPETRSASLGISGGLTGFLLHFPEGDAERWCSIGRTVVIDSRANVHPCALLMGDRFLLGNINKTSLRAIEESPRLRDLTLTCHARTETIAECRTCIWKNLCQGSCPAFAFLNKGTVQATDDLCDFRRRLYEDMIFGMAETRIPGQDS